MLILQATQPVASSGVDTTFLFTLLELLVPIVIAVILVIRFRKKIPFLGKKEMFKFGIINDTRDLSWHKIPITELKRIGVSKNLSFNYKEGKYIVKNSAIIRNDNKPTSIYQEGNPMPFKLRFDDSGNELSMSANETKEMAESKVVFDLLRFTLSKVETGVLILLIVVAAEGAIGIYFGYSTNSQVQSQNALLNQVVHYLFPNAKIG